MTYTLIYPTDILFTRNLTIGDIANSGHRYVLHERLTCPIISTCGRLDELEVFV